MKKTLLVLVMALLPFAADARGGFSDGSMPAIMSVADVKNMRDDKAVVMKGQIEKHIKKDKYQFVDETGRIVVEIDGEDWRGVNVTPNDTVIIMGETDRDWFRDVQVDVDSVQIIR